MCRSLSLVAFDFCFICVLRTASNIEGLASNGVTKQWVRPEQRKSLFLVAKPPKT